MSNSLSSCNYGDTWELNPANDTWLDRTPAVNPAARQLASMAYDSDNDRVLLFGGVRLTPMVGDACGDGSVSVSGSGMVGHCRFNDLWEWGYWGIGTCGGAATPCWRLIATSNPPSRRSGAVMAYDTTNDRLLLYGGARASTPPCTAGETAANSLCYTNDTWQLVGTSWTRLCSADPANPDCPGKPAIDFPQMVDHPPSDGVMLFGGDPSKTLLFDPITPAWRTLSTPTAPSARSGTVAVYDDARERVVLATGSRLGASGLPSDTWALK